MPKTKTVSFQLKPGGGKVNFSHTVYSRSFDPDASKPYEEPVDIWTRFLEPTGLFEIAVPAKPIVAPGETTTTPITAPAGEDSAPAGDEGRETRRNRRV